jgi:hypothetical protein
MVVLVVVLVVFYGHPAFQYVECYVSWYVDTWEQRFLLHNPGKLVPGVPRPTVLQFVVISLAALFATLVAADDPNGKFRFAPYFCRVEKGTLKSCEIYI